MKNFFLENAFACVFGPWPRAFLFLASLGSVLERAVLGLGLKPCVLDATSANTMFVCHQTEGFTPLSGIKIEINSRLLCFNFLFFKFQASQSQDLLFQHHLINCFHCLSLAQQERMTHYPFFSVSSFCLLCCTFKTFSSLRLFLSIVTLSTEETSPFLLSLILFKNCLPIWFNSLSQFGLGA